MKFARVRERRSPKIVGEPDDACVKVVKVQGEFVWHHREAEDELFLAVKGRLPMRLRDREIWLEEGVPAASSTGPRPRRRPTCSWSNPRRR